MTILRIRTALLISGAFVALLSNAADAGRLFLSDSASAPSINVNPTLTLPVNASESLFLWAELGANEQIPGLSYDVVNATSGIASTASYVIDNPLILGSSRWNAVNPGTVGELVLGTNLVRVGGGLNGGLTTFDPTFDAVANAYRVAQIEVRADAVGMTDVFLQVGPQGIALGSAGDPISFGWNDAAIANNAFGSASSLPEATIVVVPEPTTLWLAVVGSWSALSISRRKCISRKEIVPARYTT